MRVVKLNKTQDIAAVIQIIKELKEPEVVFELPKGSPLLANSTNLKLMKKTGEAMRKVVKVRTDDPMGRILALKAEVLDGGAESAALVRPMLMSKVKRSDVKPRFSDIVRSKNPRPMPAAAPSKVSKVARVVAPTAFIKSAQENLSAMTTMPKVKRRSIAKYFTMLVVILVLVVFGLAVLLPTANITVYARSEPITRDLEVNIDKSVGAPVADTLTAPASVISREVSQTKNYPATGSKTIGTKATGSVVIYNFTKNTLTLKAATTALVINGKKFFFTKDATGIRPTARIGSGSDESVDPSSLTPPVSVIADQPGADYNIAANTKFSIVNAALGNQNVYAVNSAALTGGTSTTVKVVSQADIDGATTDLTNSIATQAQADLNNEMETGDQKILASGITKEVLAKTANKNVGDQADNFDMTMIARMSGLTYHEQDVRNMIQEKIATVLSDDKYIVPDAQDKLNASFKTVDIPNGKGVLAVHYETVAAYRIDTGALQKILAGKNATEIKEVLLAKPEIDRVDVQFSPFFVNKAPKLNGKIYIQTKLSSS